ncbi:MAG: response regulator [Candidatus Omnitrophota bacterium]
MDPKENEPPAPTKVLFVEDEPDIQRLISVRLTHDPFSPFALEGLSSLGEAIEKLRHTAFDIVLLDLGLPDSQGLETFIRLNREYPNLPVVILSGLGDERLALKAVELGAQDYVVKGTGLEMKVLPRILMYALRRKNLEKQIQAAERMEAVGSLASGIAHDFNNLLLVIRGNANLLAQGLPEGDAVRSGLQEIQKAAQDAADLTAELLAFARKQTVKPVVIDLKELLEDVAKMLRSLVKESVALEIEPAGEVLHAKIDPLQLRRVITNLVANAADAIGEQGVIRITTRAITIEEGDPRLRFHLQPGRHAVLEIRDNGIGMDEELLARVFDPFFTTKGKGKGTGLGLSSSYGIICQAGGHIELASRPGEGTTARVYLPTTEESAVPISGPVPSKEELRGTETILLAEDDASVRAFTVKMLRSFGYDVVPAANGQEALQMMEGMTGYPVHLLVTDVIMPVMGGAELVEEMKKRHPEVKTLFMSGYTDDKIGKKGVLDESVPFIAKPFLPEEFLRMVRKILKN